ncbi:hypothetical protein C8Q76DRAFT_693600 [Earliella scabrosa]|nr:hypothetical protein C8Q76DRAFT_693600 [Earliella scabrosa]
MHDTPHPLTALRMTELPPCTVCGTASLFHCARCINGPPYCSPQDFLADWPNHRNTCDGAALQSSDAVLESLRSAQDASSTHKGDNNSPCEVGKPSLPTSIPEEHVATVVAMLAHPLQDSPQFVQVRLLRNTTNPVSPFPIPVLSEFFIQPYGSFLLQFGRNLSFLLSPFIIFFCLESYAHDVFPNNAIASLTKGVIPPPRPWPGTVLIMKLACAGVPDYVNFEDSDVDDVREYFVWYR